MGPAESDRPAPEPPMRANLRIVLLVLVGLLFVGLLIAAFNSDDQDSSMYRGLSQVLRLFSLIGRVL